MTVRPKKRRHSACYRGTLLSHMTDLRSTDSSRIHLLTLFLLVSYLLKVKAEKKFEQ